MSIPVLFAEHVARIPEAVAIRCGECRGPTGNLMRRQIGWRTCSQRRGRARAVCGVVVQPVCRGVVAILAVLKTGAAYLPIDPAVPAARLDFIVVDAAPVAVITTAGLADRLDGVRHIGGRCRRSGGGRQLSTALPAPAADDIAYIIYTSGTTGVPKGVAVSHHNVTQLLASLDAGLPRAGVWPQCHTLAFDVSVWEIFGGLLRGGRVVVVPEEVAGSPEDFHALLVAEQVDVLTQTPSAARVLSTQGLESTALVVAGEACPPEVVDQWAPGRVMINAYGPTETTMCVAISAPLTPGAGVPIGAPVAWGGVVRARRVVASRAGRSDR